MVLHRKERKHRTLKIYLTERGRLNNNGHYVVGGTVIPGDIIDIFTYNDNLPIIDLKPDFDLVIHPGITAALNGIEECVLIHQHEPNYKQIFIPARLIEKIVEETIEQVTSTPQYSLVESRA